MNTLYVVAAIAACATLLTSLLKADYLSYKVKNLIAVVFSTVGGLATVYLSGALEATASNVTGAILLVYGAQQALYNFLLKGTELDAKLEAVNVLPQGK